MRVQKTVLIYFLKSTASLIVGFALLFQTETAKSLTCENLFESDARAVRLTQNKKTTTPSEKSGPKETYADYVSELQDPDLFMKVLNNEVQVPADILLINLEHFQNYKQRKVEIAPITRVQIENTSENVVVHLVDDSNAKNLPKWVFENKESLVNYFLHPTNMSENIPFFKDVSRHSEGPVAVTTASRSMMIRTKDGRIFSVKIGTDHPEGKDKARNLKKLINIQEEIKKGIQHSKVAQDLEKKLLPAKKFSFAYEIASITPETDVIARYGMMIRDLEFLKSKNRLYLPAFSIPTIGEAIAKKYGKTYEEFWGENFAKLVGEAKAEMFLKYGMIMTWPHGQNILIETDLNFKPTGKIKIRDLDDIEFYKPAAQQMLPSSQFKTVTLVPDIDFRWSRTEQVIIPPALSDAPPTETKNLAANWQIQHDRAIRLAFAKALNIAEFKDEKISLKKLFKIYKEDIRSHFQRQFEEMQDEANAN